MKYKLDFIFENIHNLTDYNGNIKYLENIRYYMKIFKKILSPEEFSRIQAFAVTNENNLSNIISILKVKPLHNSDVKENNLYYLYSKNEKKYTSKTPEEIKQFINELDNHSLNIQGSWDRYNPIEVGELDL